MSATKASYFDNSATLLYDGSYAGLLSALFEVFRLRLDGVRILREADFQPGFFSDPIRVVTKRASAQRVQAGWRRYGGNPAAELARRCFLSEAEDRERILLRYLRRLVTGERHPEEDLSDPLMLRLLQLDKKMKREIHRMHAFVRFQATPDGIFAALIDPDFDVLPLLKAHFTARYPAQDWLIYDTRRRYGMFWMMEQQRIEFVTLDQVPRQLSEEQLSTVEPAYQQLWQTYFHAVDIPERRNLKLHIQHVPRRYWKYLVEKW